jgi:hypothetical protein
VYGFERLTMRSIVLFAVVLMSCGAPQLAAPLCGAEPHVNGDGTVTSIGCPWEQQYENIVHHGSTLAKPEQLSAAGAAQGVSVTNSCGEWFLGTDSGGVTVFVSASSGEVRSHGQVHPGFATSTLPETLSLPVKAE